jgi:hypothetical protein
MTSRGHNRCKRQAMRCICRLPSTALGTPCLGGRAAAHSATHGWLTGNGEQRGFKRPACWQTPAHLKRLRSGRVLGRSEGQRVLNLCRYPEASARGAAEVAHWHHDELGPPERRLDVPLRERRLGHRLFLSSRQFPLPRRWIQRAAQKGAQSTGHRAASLAALRPRGN